MEDDPDSPAAASSTGADLLGSEASEGPHVNLVFIGPCGCGKSTTAGRLIADTGAIDKQTLERVAAEASERGKPDHRFAWILDKLQCERERGNTMYVALWRFSSRRCRYTLIDAPGHNDFAKETVTAMSQADIAVLVVSAEQADEGQILEHTLLAYTLGLRQLVVCVNKIGIEACGFPEEDFNRTCDVVRKDLDHVGLKTHDVHFDMHFVPISALSGDNVAWRSANTPWYCGATLLEALDDAVACHFQTERPLRVPIREVMEIGGTGVVVSGRIVTGSLRPGMRMLFAPGNVVAEVSDIKMHHESLKEAQCGDSVNIALHVGKKEVRSGMVGSAADDHPACECASFLAQVIVIAPPRAGEIAAGSMLWVECHTVQVQCLFETLILRTDRRTGQVLEMSPTALHAGDAAVVKLKPQSPMCVEPFQDYPPLGRFAVRDQKTTVAVGVVQEVELMVGPEYSPTAKRVKAKKAVSSHSLQKVKKEHRSERSSASKESSVCKIAVRDDSGEDDAPESQLAHSLARTHTGDSAAGDTEGDIPGVGNSTAPVASTAFLSPFAAFGAVTKKSAAPHPPKRKPKPPATAYPGGKLSGGATSDLYSDG
mmetsp:Transcript_7418/g.16320  ORF Transcript_7418/g.16320 Transcript_7418/m.16320 type:complete len:598 (+) Transcript_7418:91-1884(+)